MKKYLIGFKHEDNDRQNEIANVAAASANETIPRKSLVDIYFPQRNMTLSYYNDRFDLHKGDLVYVDGKLEGKLGRVVSVNYSFKIKLSDYKQVIAFVDTNVIGDIYLAGSHVVTFNPNTMSYKQVLPWFKAPEPGDEEYVSGEDGESFLLDDMLKFDFHPGVPERGGDYYNENKVVYIEVNKTHGRAIVEGSKIYELEFEYAGGNISNLVCSCYCNYFCKHEFAAMLQLHETLGFINDNYAGNYEDYFAAMSKGAFLSNISHRETGKITLG